LTLFGIAALAVSALAMLPSMADTMATIPPAALILATAGLALLALRR
jgi:hypothetical protein